jgi:Lon protease-like protein
VPELPSRIPLFPLPETVLFPLMPLPLHVFEPRYVKMVKDAWQGSRLVGIVLLRPGWERTYYGRPPIYPVGCAGLLEECDPLDDGRFNILLRGLARFRVLDEHFGQPYRLAEVEYTPESDGNPAALVQVRAQVLAFLGRQVDGALAVREDVPHEVFVNALGQSLDLSPVERQSLIECGTIEDRGTQLLEILKFHRLERASRSGGDSTPH